MEIEQQVSRQSTHLSHLHCSVCDKQYPPDRVNTFASCDRCAKNVLLCRYDGLEDLTPAQIIRQDRSMWRYFPWLPVFDRANVVSLGEGFTPVIMMDKLAGPLGLDRLSLKDESLNPTGSFKARGMSMAISKAKELGIHRCIVPTAGNAGGAMSAYCARAGMEAIVVMPRHTPHAFKEECEKFGATLILEDGLISDCARRVAEMNRDGVYFDVSTLKEPYRLEGKKTLGYEIAEQFGWELPDVILYPTGGGTGLIGMWKAFKEMIAMGWIADKLPRMYCVQAENCQPILETWFGRQQNAQHYSGKATVASGLAVPNPMGEALIIRVMRESGGWPVSVSENEILSASNEIARQEGLLIAPEGGALLAALKHLVHNGSVQGSEQILLLNTGSGYKYLD